MENLPCIALRLIYEFDNTYRHKYDEVIKEFKVIIFKSKSCKTNERIVNTKYGIINQSDYYYKYPMRRKNKKNKYYCKKHYFMKIYNSMFTSTDNIIKAEEYERRQDFILLKWFCWVDKLFYFYSIRAITKHYQRCQRILKV